MKTAFRVKWTAAFVSAGTAGAQTTTKTVRARDLGVPFDGTPGRFNAITDVPGVLVGHSDVRP